VTAADVEALLARYQFTFMSEDELQEAIHEVLARHVVEATREVRLSGRDRIDLLTADGVGIEVKCSRSATTADVLRQLQRYATHDSVRELLLVTTRGAHTSIPVAVGGKPCRVLFVRGIG
jgi:hypothetical protein